MKDEYYRVHQDRYRYLINQIDQLNLPQGASILDIGCYPLHLYNMLAKRGYQLYGIASPHEPILHNNVHLLNIEKDKLPFSPHKFDLILISEVIEHLPNYPLSLLVKIRPLLKHNGLLIITTPNVSRLYNIFSLILGRNIYFPLNQMSQTKTSNLTIYHRHNREYTAPELLHLLTQAKFEVISTKYFTAYTPWRQSTSTSIPFLAARWLVFFIASIFGQYRDSLYLLSRSRKT